MTTTKGTIAGMTARPGVTIHDMTRNKNVTVAPANKPGAGTAPVIPAQGIANKGSHFRG